MRVAGVMSGTSLDGIDVAIIETTGHGVETIGFLSVPYPALIREDLLRVSGGGAGSGATSEISRLNFALGGLYARAVVRAMRRFGPARLIGCHGQTIYHEGGSHTLQIGEAAIIAERTGLPVVSNFRARDVAAGGQGAPLVPFVDYLLFRNPRRRRVALNIGGIANITDIPAGAAPEDVAAFDTGPGNMVIDALTRQLTKGAMSFDRDGLIASSGKIDHALLSELLTDKYYRRKPPKSAGREQYGAAFVERLTKTGLPLRDLIATATALTAASIAAGIRMRSSGPADLIVSGGGSHNRQIMSLLAAFLPEARISTSTDHGVDADAKEAIAFAVLAYQTWCGRASNLPSATGAKRPVILGNITH